MIRVGLTSINKPSVSMHGFRSLDRRRVNSSRVNVYALLLAKAAWYYPQLPDTLRIFMEANPVTGKLLTSDDSELASRSEYNSQRSSMNVDLIVESVEGEYIQYVGLQTSSKVRGLRVIPAVFILAEWFQNPTPPHVITMQLLTSAIRHTPRRRLNRTL